MGVESDDICHMGYFPFVKVYFRDKNKNKMIDKWTEEKRTTEGNGYEKER